MPFQFSLRALLRLRQAEEQRERLRLAVLNTSRQKMSNEYDEVGRRRAMTFEKLQRRLQAGVSGAELRLDHAPLQLSAGQRRKLAALIEALDLQVRKQVAAFSESQRKRKTLENLQEREWRAFQQIENRREQQRVDDLFAQRHSPRHQG